MKDYWLLKKVHEMVKPLSPSEMDYFSVLFMLMLGITIAFAVAVVLIAIG